MGLSHVPPEKQPKPSPDIGDFVRSSDSKSDHERHNLIVLRFVPDDSYKFTRHADGRSFQHQWQMKYPWLKFSEQDSGAWVLSPLCFV